jgi:hypothetical protein
VTRWWSRPTTWSSNWTSAARPTPPRQQQAIVIGSKFPMFSGVDIEGVTWVPRDSACRLIRITDDNCAYCNRDRSAYESLVRAATSASCEIIEIAPRAGGISGSPHLGVIQLKFTDTNLGAVLYPFVTPQTLLLDENWTVRMNRRGITDESTLETARQLFEAFTAESSTTSNLRTVTGLRITQSTTKGK